MMSMTILDTFVDYIEKVDLDVVVEYMRENAPELYTQFAEEISNV
jgi:hypothetical protein